MDTIKMGKRGTLVLPAKLRKQFGLEDGSLLITEAANGEIRLRPAVAYEVEIFSPERKAEFLLNNSLSQEDWDSATRSIVAMGLDPNQIANTDPGGRNKLPTRAELEMMFDRIETKQLIRKSA